MVDYNGLENRRTERCRGFESLSLRRIIRITSWLSIGYANFYTLRYPKSDPNFVPISEIFEKDKS